VATVLHVLQDTFATELVDPLPALPQTQDIRLCMMELATTSQRITWQMGSPFQMCMLQVQEDITVIEAASLPAALTRDASTE
jgi:hypothetical protein